MYRRADSPDWCVALSGSCYPTKPAAQILANLTAGGYDAHIEGQEVKPELRNEEWHRMFFNSLNVKALPYPSVDRRLRPLIRYFRLPYFIGRHFSTLPQRFQVLRRQPVVYSQPPCCRLHRRIPKKRRMPLLLPSIIRV